MDRKNQIKKMSGVNKVILVGNVGKDPIVRTVEEGIKVASFSLATTETYKDKHGHKQDKTEWHNIVLWRGLAEVAEKYLNKGSKVYIEGKLSTRSYEQDGITKYTTEIIGKNMVMLTPKGFSNQETQKQDYKNPITEYDKRTGQPDKTVMGDTPEDLPF